MSFIGVYTASRVCDNNSDLYSITISRATTNCEGIILSNVYNTGSSAFGTVTTGQFAILPLQSFDVYTLTNGSASVNVTTDVVTLTFDIDDGTGSTEGCTVTMTPN